VNIGQRFYQFIKQETTVLGNIPATNSPGDPYAILGIDVSLPFPEKKKRYLLLQQLVHPDRGGDNALAGLVNRAWEEVCQREGKR